MISDPKNRPVYTTCASDEVALYLPNREGAYEFDRTYLNVDDLKREHPDAVRHVSKRTSSNNKRHPHVHYRPTRRGWYCRTYLPDESTLGDDEIFNARSSTDVAGVTCPVCVKAIQQMIVRKTTPRGANA